MALAKLSQCLALLFLLLALRHLVEACTNELRRAQRWHPWLRRHLLRLKLVSSTVEILWSSVRCEVQQDVEAKDVQEGVQDLLQQVQLRPAGHFRVHAPRLRPLTPPLLLLVDTAVSSSLFSRQPRYRLHLSRKPPRAGNPLSLSSRRQLLLLTTLAAIHAQPLFHSTTPVPSLVAIALQDTASSGRHQPSVVNISIFFGIYSRLSVVLKYVPILHHVYKSLVVLSGLEMIENNLCVKKPSGLVDGAEISVGIKKVEMAATRNVGEGGEQFNQFLVGLTALLQEQSCVHGEQIQQLIRVRESEYALSRVTTSTLPVYRQFRELGPTEFKGSTDPMVAEGWIRSLETIYDFMQLTEVEKVRCAIFMLRDDARIWLAREFLELRQGYMAVAEYVKKFERDCYFVPMIASQPQEELKHFVEVLKAVIRHDIRLSIATSLREGVDQALMSERDINEMVKEAQNKRASYQGRDQLGSGKKKTASIQHSGKQQQKQPSGFRVAVGTTFTSGDKVPCSQCGKIHAGQCLSGSNMCYKCKEQGHYARNCPQLKEPTKGRVFAMTRERVDLNAAIITGKLDFVSLNKSLADLTCDWVLGNFATNPGSLVMYVTFFVFTAVIRIFVVVDGVGMIAILRLEEQIGNLEHVSFLVFAGDL
ncbi:hypothetical protein ZIOFF_040575 [Zingiber officinale]|uniref:CCHC-type domain-containing protein n=1 Tax=Zingiber officinale TaxID=94328 RepID=A0A8J5L4M4_ZINOF|nr:hypothetical protein ZIOFF_040575 [Zingiber officinale]